MLPELDDIKRKRKNLELRQSELAKKAGVSQSLIAKLERRKIIPSYDKTKKIFDVLEKLELEKEKKAGDICNPDITGVDVQDKVKKAIEIMKKNDFSQLPVFKNNFPVGSISEKTILEELSQGRYNVSDYLVEGIMEDSFPIIPEDLPLSSIISLLKSNFAVLVTKKEKVLGIITKADLLKVV